jgi:hypothetical protein
MLGGMGGKGRDDQSMAENHKHRMPDNAKLPPSDIRFAIKATTKQYDPEKGFVYLELNAGDEVRGDARDELLGVRHLHKRWMPWLVSALAKLDGFRAMRFRGITEAGLSSLANGNLPALAFLVADDCGDITDVGLSALANGKLRKWGARTIAVHKKIRRPQYQASFARRAVPFQSFYHPFPFRDRFFYTVLVPDYLLKTAISCEKTR